MTKNSTRSAHIADDELNMPARIVKREAITLATTDIFSLSGWILLALLALAWFTRPARPLGR